MLALGWLSGDRDAVIADESYRQFFMHGTSHWLGMDVHDVGDYKKDGQWRPLAPGMVLTIEPGLYVAPETAGVNAAYWGIGIRIEDDVVVTGDEPEVLTHGVPKATAAVEALVGGSA